MQQVPKLAVQRHIQRCLPGTRQAQYRVWEGNSFGQDEGVSPTGVCDREEHKRNGQSDTDSRQQPLGPAASGTAGDGLPTAPPVPDDRGTHPQDSQPNSPQRQIGCRPNSPPGRLGAVKRRDRVRACWQCARIEVHSQQKQGTTMQQGDCSLLPPSGCGLAHLCHRSSACSRPIRLTQPHAGLRVPWVIRCREAEIRPAPSHPPGFQPQRRHPPAPTNRRRSALSQGPARLAAATPRSLRQPRARHAPVNGLPRR